MKNQVYSGQIAPLTVPLGGVVAGSMYLIGAMVVVAAVTAEAGAKANFARCGAFNLTCKAVDKDGNSEIAEGQALYIQDDGQIDKDVGGTFCGFAWSGLAAGATGTVLVELASGAPAAAAPAPPG